MIKQYWSAFLIIFFLSCSNFEGQINKIVCKNRSNRNRSSVEFELLIYNKSTYSLNKSPYIKIVGNKLIYKKKEHCSRNEYLKCYKEFIIPKFQIDSIKNMLLLFRNPYYYRNNYCITTGGVYTIIISNYRFHQEIILRNKYNSTVFKVIQIINNIIPPNLNKIEMINSNIIDTCQPWIDETYLF